MLNQVVLVGRIVSEPELKETDMGKNVSNITLAVPRTYKNADGEYDVDYVDCELWQGIAQNTCEYCHKGDLIGVKGRIEVDNFEVDGEKRKNTKVLAEKVTFLSTAKVKEEIAEKETKKESKKNRKEKEVEI